MRHLHSFFGKAPAALVWLACALASAPSAAADALVRLRGSSTFLPLMQSVAEDYMARHGQVNVIVTGGGSSRGYKALLDDTADVAFTSGPIPEALQREAERQGLKLRFTTVGYRALVAAVHPSQPMHDISLAELRAVFTGRMTKWPAAHGHKPQPIEVMVGRPTSGVTLVWRELVLHEDDTFTPKAQVVTEERRHELLATMPNAVTFLPLGTPDRARTKTLLVNGVAPTAPNVLSGTYPLRAELVLVTREKSSAATAAFLKAFSEPRPNWRLDGLIIGPKTAAVKP